MSCPESDKVKLYATESLSKSEEHKFQAHLASCPQCQKEVEMLLRNDTLVKELKAEYNQANWQNPSLSKDVSVTNFFLTGLTGRKNILELLPGQHLGIKDRYRIIRRLGQKDANVYHTYDTERGHEVVLKIVVSDSRQVEKTCNQLSRELASRSSIDDYTNIVITYDIHTAQYEGFSLVLLSMEYADGGSLRGWLSENRHNKNRRITEGLALLEQSCSAIRVIHKAGLVHRDIKPENILLCRNGNNFIVKLTDFGISCNISDISSATEHNLTIAGTPLYMSPEQFSHDELNISPVSDIYSFGVVIYEIMAGKPPFYGNFKQLRDEHINKQPPKLTGELHKWGQIVGKCLQKDPQKRYGNIDELISDINRLKKGLAISVDISCPECGHVNLNIDTTSCENCHTSLDSIFRLCPICNREVRLDVEHCPGCGQNVASYYTLKERQQKVETLKDESPVEAIKLLELILREGAGDFHKRAVELIRDLREKQQRLESLIQEATEAEANGNPEKAIKLWNEVLKIVARHKTAKQQLKRLRSLSTQFGNQWKEAIGCMDRGNFEQAEKLLENCLDITPNHSDILKLLDDCRSRSTHYNQALENALIAGKSKRLLRAKEQVLQALTQAPKSSKALKLQSDTDSKLEKVESLFSKSVEEFNGAQFSKLAETIKKIEEIQSDSTFLSDSKKKDIFSNRDKYLDLIKQTQMAFDSQELDKAVAKIKAALKICPKSNEAKRIYDGINSNKTEANHLINKAISEIRASRFERAHGFLDKAANLYPSLEEIKLANVNLLEVETIYCHSKQKTKELFLKRNLDEALGSANTAQQLCPDSEEIAALIKDIKTDQRVAEKTLKDVQEYLLSARFDKVSENIKKAKNLWRSFDLLSEIEAQAKQIADSFNSRILSVKQHQKQGDLEIALEACQGALEICPGSKDASDLLKIIQTDQAYVKKYIEEARVLLRSADFDKVRNKIEAAKKIWSEYEKLSEAESQAKEVAKTFNHEMSSAEQLLEANSLENSQAACQAALKICPDSEKADELLKRINRAIEEDKAKKRRKEDIKTTILDIVFMPYAIIVTIVVFLVQHWKIGLTVIAIALLGYGAFLGFFWFADHLKTTIMLFIGVPVIALIVFRS